MFKLIALLLDLTLPIIFYQSESFPNCTNFQLFIIILLPSIVYLINLNDQFLIWLIQSLTHF